MTYSYFQRLNFLLILNYIDRLCKYLHTPVIKPWHSGTVVELTERQWNGHIFYDGNRKYAFTLKIIKYEIDHLFLKSMFNGLE